MNLFKRFFRPQKDEEALPPLSDPVLGNLHWDMDVDGWVGTVGDTNPPVRLFLGTGSAQAYPSDEIRALLRAPYQDFAQVSNAAISFLRDSGICQSRNVDPGTLVVDGLETYTQYLADKAYTITFADADETAIWRVNFENGQPVSSGVDD